MQHFVTLLTCLLLFSQVQAQAGWIQLNSSTSQNLNGIHMHNAFEGYVVGDSGTALQTIDAAQTWTQMNVPAGANYTSVAFLNQDTGYITPDFGDILYTHDAGATWTADSTTFNGLCYWKKIRVDANGLNWILYDGCFQNYEVFTWDPNTGDTTVLALFGLVEFGHQHRDIDFPSPGSAVVVGDSGMIFRTIDSGDNWNQIAFADSNQNFLSVDFVDANTGYAFSQDLFYPKFITVDGGLNWAVDSTWLPNQTFFYPQFTDIEYLPSGNGIMAGNSSGSGGVAFYNGYNSLTHSSTTSLNGVDMITDSIAFVIGDGGYMAQFGDILLSIDEVPVKKALGVYPNPTNGGTYFIAPDRLPSGAKVELFDLRGQLVYQEILPNMFEEEAHRMDLENLPNGSYVLTLSTDANRWNQRLVKVD